MDEQDLPTHLKKKKKKKKTNKNKKKTEKRVMPEKWEIDEAHAIIAPVCF